MVRGRGPIHEIACVQLLVQSWLYSRQCKSLLLAQEGGKYAIKHVCIILWVSRPGAQRFANPLRSDTFSIAIFWRSSILAELGWHKALGSEGKTGRMLEGIPSCGRAGCEYSWGLRKGVPMCCKKKIIENCCVRDISNTSVMKEAPLKFRQDLYMIFRGENLMSAIPEMYIGYICFILWTSWVHYIYVLLSSTLYQEKAEYTEKYTEQVGYKVFFIWEEHSWDFLLLKNLVTNETQTSHNFWS